MAIGEGKETESARAPTASPSPPYSIFSYCEGIANGEPIEEEADNLAQRQLEAHRADRTAQAFKPVISELNNHADIQRNIPMPTGGTYYTLYPNTRPIDEMLSLAILKPAVFFLPPLWDDARANLERLEAPQPPIEHLTPIREALNRQAQRTPASAKSASYNHYSHRFKQRAQPLREERQRAQVQKQIDNIKPILRAIFVLTSRSRLTFDEQDRLTALRCKLSASYAAKVKEQEQQTRREFNAIKEGLKQALFYTDEIEGHNSQPPNNIHEETKN